MMIKTSKRNPITPAQVEQLRDFVIAALEVEPQSTRYFTDQLGLTKSAMSKHMSNLEKFGLIKRDDRKRKANSRMSFIWRLVGHAYEDQPDLDADVYSGLPKRIHKATWPACKVAQQNPWSALGL